MKARSRVPRPAPLAALGALILLTVLVGPALAAGPPYPEPVTGQRVYDTAGVLSDATKAEAQRIIEGIEARTGAQVVVYTQLKPESDTPELAEQDALALMNQWGVGRKGFDDGLVILYDLDNSLRHGQVQLYAGPGFRTSFLSNEERQAIYENDMLPLLRGGDLDGALLAALAKVDASATPAHAQDLERGRLVNAVVGLLVGPGLFLVLVGWTLFHWLRFGRDPVYIDDPSVLMPAPPADLTAASGALVYDGQSSRRTLTTALLDLASRGELAFERDDALFHKKVVDPDEGVPPADDEEAARRRLNARKPLSSAETYALDQLRDLSSGPDVLEDDDLLKFGAKTDDFDRKLEAFAVDHGWFAEAPGKVVRRWTGGAAVELARRSGRALRRLPDPVLRARRPRRRAPRGRGRDARHRPLDARPDDGRRHDPGDAGGLPPDAREDDGTGPLDGPGRRRGEARLARDAGPGDGLGRRARPPAPGRAGPRAQP